MVGRRGDNGYDKQTNQSGNGKNETNDIYTHTSQLEQQREEQYTACAEIVSDPGTTTKPTRELSVERITLTSPQNQQQK